MLTNIYCDLPNKTQRWLLSRFRRDFPFFTPLPRRPVFSVNVPFLKSLQNLIITYRQNRSHRLFIFRISVVESFVKGIWESPYGDYVCVTSFIARLIEYTSVFIISKNSTFLLILDYHWIIVLRN